jgi:protein-disulfide isomerase
MFTPSTPWYKHGVGKAFVIFLGTIGAAIIVFAILVAYYFIQYQAGRLTTIEREIYAGRQSTIGTTSPPPSQIIQNPTSLIRPHNPTLGEANAPLTIIMFIDFECPFCQDDYETMNALRATYGEAARFVFKHFPVEQIHPHARAAAIAASCANEEGAFWSYYDRLFTTKDLSEEGLVASAKAVNIYNSQFIACRASTKPATDIEVDMNDAYSIDIKGTPTYIVNGIRVDGNIPLSSWQNLIVDALQVTNTGTN